ncbi:single-stranded DNA exonuclease RecJ [Candidatus Nitromaritima sp. SCGC AAA799-C22]|nr:single-stranded DNA exonuclease RecJ [Candidatus Nitromaritima sp. SCGC AAA799-C22]
MLSLLNKRWILRSPAPDRVDELARSLGVSPVVARLLINRKVRTADDARAFLESDLASLHDPFLITGMEPAVDRILKAIADKESIRLFCDYDVDGVTSAAFLTHFFRDLGVEVGYYLPERMKEGYGLNEQAVRTIRDEGDSLMITADCGITSVREVELACSIGLDVIITDHHQVGGDGLPPAVAVLNPHRPDCDYPYRFLSGVGLAFKLAVAVRNALHHKAGWEKEKLPNMRRHLDLVALGTIADVAPLTGENHVLARHGLEVLTTTDKPGLVALKSVADVDNRVGARAVGFALGPRLNAAGRLGKADSGFHLLTSVDLKEAKELARELDETNKERKKIQEQAQEEAEYLTGREVDLEKDMAIVLASENFHSGVVGIVASRLAEKYFRPVVLIALDKGIGKGSARSIPRFNLHRAFTECAGHLVQFGGHAYAAGLTIEEGKVDSFRDAMNDVGNRILSEEDLIPELLIDTPLDISEIGGALYGQISLMEPFGAENPSPVFLLRGVRVSGLRLIGRERTHVRFQAVQGRERIDAVGFNLAREFSSIDTESDSLDLACELQVNDWNGRNKLELKVLDLRC